MLETLYNFGAITWPVLLTAIIAAIRYFLKKMTTESKLDQYVKYSEPYKKARLNNEKSKFIDDRLDLLGGKLYTGYASPAMQKVYMYLSNRIDIDDDVKIITKFTKITGGKLKCTIEPLIYSLIAFVILAVITLLITFFIQGSNNLTPQNDLAIQLILYALVTLVYLTLIWFFFLLMKWGIFKFCLKKKYAEIIKKAKIK